MGEKRPRSSLEGDFLIYTEAILAALCKEVEKDKDNYAEAIVRNFNEMILQIDQLLEDEKEIIEGDCIEDNYPKMPFLTFPSFPSFNPNKLKEIGQFCAWNHPYRIPLGKGFFRIGYHDRQRVGSVGSKNQKNSVSSSSSILESVGQQISTCQNVSLGTPKQIGQYAILFPDDTPSLPYLTNRSSMGRNSSESLIPIAEQELEPRLLQFMAENPLGRTCLPLRFHQLMDNTPKDSTLHATHQDSDPSTPGTSMVLDTPKQSPKTPQIPQPPSISLRPQEELPPKSPGVKQLISLFSRHVYTSNSKISPGFTRTPQRSGRAVRLSKEPTPALSNRAKVIVTPAVLPPRPIPCSQDNNLQSRQLLTTSALLKAPFARGQTPPPVQPQGDVTVDAMLLSESSSGGRISNERNSIRTSFQYSSVPTPDFTMAKDEDDVDQVDIPIPTDRDARSEDYDIRVDGHMEDLTLEEKRDEEKEQCDNDGTKDHRIEQSTENEESLGLISPRSSFEIPRKRFLSVDPNVINDSLKDMEDLGLEILRKRGEPKNIEILVHPGQQKRQKAKEINWVPGIVQRVQFRGDENRIIQRNVNVDKNEIKNDTSLLSLDSVLNNDEKKLIEGFAVEKQSYIESNILGKKQEVTEEVCNVTEMIDMRNENDSEEDQEDETSDGEEGTGSEEPNKTESEDDSETSLNSSELILSSNHWNKENKEDFNNRDHPGLILSNLQICKEGNFPPSKMVLNLNHPMGSMIINSQHIVSTTKAKEFIEPMVLRKSPSKGLNQLTPSVPGGLNSATRLLPSSANRSNTAGGSNAGSAIPKPPSNAVTSLSLTSIQSKIVSKVGDGWNDVGINQQNGSSAGIPRLTPRGPPLKKRMHRFLKPVESKNWEEQADLSEDEGEVKHRTGIRVSPWANHTATWHHEVKRQTSIDPITIFGCGVRPVEFKDIFKTPDFHRAYRDLPNYQHHRHHNLNPKEMFSQEGRAEKVKKWTQDKRQCGFGVHEGVTMHEVLRFRERVGRHEDVSSLVWDQWTLCSADCEHNSTTRQPWFQQIGASPSPYRMENGLLSPDPTSGSASSTGRRRVWGSPLPSARCLENVEEGDEDACRGTSRSPPPNYMRGLFWNSVGNLKPTVPPINLAGLTPKNVGGSKPDAGFPSSNVVRNQAHPSRLRARAMFRPDIATSKCL